MMGFAPSSLCPPPATNLNLLSLLLPLCVPASCHCEPQQASVSAVRQLVGPWILWVRALGPHSLSLLYDVVGLRGKE